MHLIKILFIICNLILLLYDSLGLNPNQLQGGTEEKVNYEANIGLLLTKRPTWQV
jgi:hypothetical protein